MKSTNKILVEQFLKQNDKFLSKVNAINKNTGELMIVSNGEDDKHVKAVRSNHIINTLKKKDIEMMIK